MICVVLKFDMGDTVCCFLLGCVSINSKEMGTF